MQEVVFSKQPVATSDILSHMKLDAGTILREKSGTGEVINTK